MADAILGSVIQVAQAIYAIIQGNIAVGEEEKELGEFCQLITSSLSGVDGEQASNFKDPLSTMLHYLEEAKGLIEHLHKRKGLQKAFEMLNPQAMLDKLAACQAKLMKVNQILGVAFSADAAKKQQEAAREEFDAVAVINHVSAKTFWRKQFGSKEYEVKWTRLKGSFQREYKADLQGLLTEENFKILKDRLDGDGDGSISVYDFAEFTDDFGLLKAFLRAVKPESALEKLPESKGAPSELLKRTVFIDSALMFDVQDVGPIRNALEEAAGGGIFKCIKFETGVLVEFVQIEHITQMLEVDLSKKKKMERKLKIDWAKCTVDEVWQKLWDAEEEKKQKLEAGGKGVKAEEAQAAVSLELKLLQEEQAQKVQEHQDEHKEKMAAVEKEARAAAMAKAGGDAKGDSKLTPEQQAALEAEVAKEIEAKKQALAQEFAEKERKLEEQRQKETNKLKNKYANLKFLTDIFAPSKEKIQNDFMDYFQDNKDETVIEYFQCSVNRREYFGDVPRVGNMYITEFGLYFYSSVFGSETREILRFGEITTMEKRKYLAFPTALGFHVIFDNDPDDKRDLEFVTFVDRNAAFNKIEEVWDQFVKKNGGTLVAAGDRVTFEKNFVIKKEGKLQKKGAVVQNWKERWFVLSEHTFTYAKKKGDPIIRAIPLAKVGDCRIDEKNRKQFLFHVITKERTFECKAKNAKEMEEWVDKIKDCLAALRLSFYYGVIVQGKNVYQPMWRVLELNFTMKCVRLMNQGRVVVQVPFEQVHRTDRDHENPMVFYIFMKSGLRHHYICQTGEDREAIVDILERITKRGNKMVEELLRLRKQIFTKEKEKSIAAASSPANGSAKDMKSPVAADVKSPKDGDVKRLDEAQKAIAALERSLHVEAGNVIDDLRNQQAVVIRRGALSRVSTVFNDKRYCILENRDEGARLTIYQSDISVIPLDIIALKNCTLLQDNEYRFAVFSSMTDRPWHFEAETPAIRAEWMTSLLFSMYPLPVGQSALAMDGAPNTTGGGIGMFSTLGPAAEPQPRQSAMNIALNAPPALVIANSNTAGGSGRQRGYTGVGQPPPYVRDSVAGGEGEKEGYPSQREGKSSASPSLARPSSVTPMQASGALIERENEVLQLKLKLAEALKKLDGAVKDRDSYQTEARENDRKLLIMKDNFDIAQAGLFGLFVRQGAMLLKHQKSGSPQPRFVFLSDNAQSVCWTENNTEKQRKKAKELKSNGVKEIRKGISSDAFVKPKYIADAQAKLCFTVFGADRTLDFQCETEEQRDMWCEALAKVIGKALRKPVPITTGPSGNSPVGAAAGGGAASPPGSPSVSSPGSDR